MAEQYDAEYVRAVYERHVDDVFRICFSYLQNVHDCEDAVSAVFIKLMKHQPQFFSEEQERAWLIVTACNHCKSLLRLSLRHPKVDISSLPEQKYWEDTEHSDLLKLVLSLPEKHRTVVYLHFFMGYSLAEIAKMMKVNESTVRSRLFHGKKKLLKMMGGNEYEKAVQ